MMISALPLARPPDPDMPARCQVRKNRRTLFSLQVELRGGVPVGLWMGLAVPQALPQASQKFASQTEQVLEVMLLCILGNMIPIPLILAALRTLSRCFVPKKPDARKD